MLKNNYLIDTHAHLDVEQFDQDRQEVIDRIRKAGFRAIINASFDLASSKRSVELAKKYSFIYALVGVHPHEVEKNPPDYLKQIKNLAQNKKVVAIGEIGLDYYRDLSPRQTQQQVFREQLALCRELELPVVIHDRDAHGDILDILKKDGVSKRGGVMHCYSGSWEMAKICLNMGFYLSIAGPFTYPKSNKLKEVVKNAPLDKILVETDCPYLAPQARRGKRNEPIYVEYILEEIASLREIDKSYLTELIFKNAQKIFDLA